MKTEINTLWIGPATRLVRECLSSMARAGCTVKLHAYARDESLLGNGIEHADAAEIFPESEIFTYDKAAGAGSGSLAAFANLFRYRLLAERGGWWMDADMYMLRPPEDKQPYVFSVEPGLPELLHNGVMKVPPMSPFMREVDRQATLAPRKGILWGTTGARLLTRTMNRHFRDLRQFALNPVVFCPIHSMQMRALLAPPCRCTSCRPPARLPERLVKWTTSVHLWNEMWRRAGADPDADHPIYAWLAHQAELAKAREP